ncbi:hypothetical protein [Streptomyces sp. NBC_01615]|uniref:hypothetical protein n=1 Tax=Streptomyces sp. NBC_01615 TaxID=2975898 RepID=UPI003867A2D5
MAPLEHVMVPPHDRVGAHRYQELAKLLHRKVVEQAGEDSAVGDRERGLADLALQHEQLVSQGKDLDAFVPIAHRQQAQERDGVGRGEVGQAQQHDRS